MSEDSLTQTYDAAALHSLRRLFPLILTLAAAVFAVTLLLRLLDESSAVSLIPDTTPGELGQWVAGQSEEESPRSFLGQLARSQALAEGLAGLPEDRLISLARALLLLFAIAHVAAIVAAMLGLILYRNWRRPVLVVALLLTMGWQFLLPPGEQNENLALILPCGLALLLALILLQQTATKTLGFVLIISMLLLGVQTAKLFAASRNYRITTALPSWRYSALADLDTALNALADGELDAVLADRRDLRDILAPLPADPDVDPADTDWPALRYHTRLDGNESLLGILPVTPRFPGRLALATAAESDLASVQDLHSLRLGTVAGDFADERYLAQERHLVLLDLKIFNDINLPHLQQITEALLQPARRNGPLLLLRILIEAAGHTWSEAIFGFVFGASLGFVLGTVFAHFSALERGLLPYVVASQTVPTQAIPPLVAIWLGAGPLSLPAISSYLTFFPVTINTLRGLRSPHPNAFELMDSWAASRWQIMWKLRFRAALPYLFTALKVSATASVVGAIIGELPSSIRSGLGRAILDFSSDYSAISTPKLWGAILMAATVGMLSFLIVSFVEWLVLRNSGGRT
ncbi:MAG: ABC transporter permease subunit [Anaerolineae bacterium]|nr:ABC transporter permease subunit [Anaerolineae bacterium]